MTAHLRRTRYWLGVAAVLGVGACTAELPSPPDYTVAVGQQLVIQLRTFGAGPVYDSTPVISSAAIRQVSVTEPGEAQTPGGPTQFFQFEAQAPGRTTITFHRPGTNVVHTDVVEVQ